MKHCPSCNAENVDDAVFCDNCGTSLAQPVAPAAAAAAPAAVPVAVVAPPPPPAPPLTAPVAATSPEAVGVKCGKCGTMNETTALFCENCGKPLAAPTAAVPPPAPEPLATAEEQPPIPPPPAPTAPVAPPSPPAAPVAPPAAAPAPAMITAIPATQPPPAGHPRFVVAASGMYFDVDGRAELMIGRVDPISGIFPEIDLTAHGGDEGGVSRKHCKITLAGNQFFAEDLNSSNGTWIGTTRLQPGVRSPLNNGDQLRLGKLLLNFFTGI